MADTIPILPSLSFLPDNFRENSLFKELAEDIDLALTPGSEFASIPLDPILAELNLEYTDIEAVTAYFNQFVKPVIGTPASILFAFNLLKINSTLKEWFSYLAVNNLGRWVDCSTWEVPANNNNLTWNTVQSPADPFWFEVVFDSLPPNFNYQQLVSMILALKNERSFLSAITIDGSKRRWVDCDTWLTEIDGTLNETWSSYTVNLSRYR
jgi:hypothetical protein